VISLEYEELILWIQGNIWNFKKAFGFARFYDLFCWHGVKTF
jgi:hypothetical protein